MQHQNGQNEDENTVDPDRAWLRIVIHSRIGGTEGQQVPSGAAESGPRKKLSKLKVSFYQATDDGNRMRAAFVATQPVERRPSLSAFICEAVTKEVERLERLYNGGRPWPDIETGQVPKGAPLRRLL
ncbi:hypothetical protein [Arthrobacter sp. NPDC058127]|uniref:ParB family protein n=1 Tax=Arthrobacter sp. NPDC058127 TaxID=3346351 RepID=UPI0036E5D227